MHTVAIATWSQYLSGLCAVLQIIPVHLHSLPTPMQATAVMGVMVTTAAYWLFSDISDAHLTPPSCCDKIAAISHFLFISLCIPPSRDLSEWIKRNKSSDQRLCRLSTAPRTPSNGLDPQYYLDGSSQDFWVLLHCGPYTMVSILGTSLGKRQLRFTLLTPHVMVLHRAISID